MLLDKLIERQRDLYITDEAFARLLGIPRSTWQLTRTRRKPLARRVALATRETFSDLARDADIFLRQRATDITDDVSEVDEDERETAAV